MIQQETIDQWNTRVKRLNPRLGVEIDQGSQAVILLDGDPQTFLDWPDVLDGDVDTMILGMECLAWAQSFDTQDGIKRVMECSREDYSVVEVRDE